MRTRTDQGKEVRRALADYSQLRGADVRSARAVYGANAVDVAPHTSCRG